MNFFLILGCFSVFCYHLSALLSSIRFAKRVFVRDHFTSARGPEHYFETLCDKFEALRNQLQLVESVRPRYDVYRVVRTGLSEIL